MKDEFRLDSASERLVPSPALCKRLQQLGWKTSNCFGWREWSPISYELKQASDVNFVYEGVLPAPTAEELLMAFNKLPLVKAPEIHYDSQFGMWQVWWENAKTHYMEHAEPAVKLADAAFNAYMQAKGEK